MSDYAAKLRTLMQERDISGNALAARVPCNRSYIYRVASGQQQGSRKLARRLDEVLSAGGALVAAFEQNDARPDAALPDGAPDIARLTDWIDAMERRNLLALAGLGMIPWSAAESLRSTLARIAGSSDSAADWQAAVSGYATAMFSIPPAKMLPDLLADLNEVSALAAAGHPDQDAMLQVAAALAAFTSMATYDCGYPARAFRWWKTAQDLADRSGYVPLRAWVRARRGADVLYGRRMTGPALALADDAIRITGGQPSAGLAEAYALRAAALAASGDPAARVSLDELRRTAGALPGYRETFTRGAGPGEWRDESRLRDAQTWTLVKLGDAAAARRAGQPCASPFTQMGVAVALAIEGKADDAIGHAVSTLSGLSDAENTLSVREKGHDVLAALPAGARTAPAARELRALTAGALR